MIFQKLRDLSEGQVITLRAESWSIEMIRLVTGVLILGKDVTPEFLVLAHELIDSVSIPILLFIEVDKHDLLLDQSAWSLLILI